MKAQILRLTNGREVVLCADDFTEYGGYGVVCKGFIRGDRLLELTPVAVKFLRGASCRDRNKRKLLERRFEHEIKMIKRLNKLAKKRPNRIGGVNSNGHWIVPQQFPLYIGEGVARGRRFYVMEWLEPFDLRSLKTEIDRFFFASGLCEAVSWLHEMGFVHCDLKPANIMHRPNGGVVEYVFVDFGTIHKKEDPIQGVERHRKGRNTLSVDQDGVRYYPHTPGYADPTYDRHTIYFDIYSIGQILRDMFEDEVPVSWAQIINKCISRWWKYRYKSVNELSLDIDSLTYTKREEIYWKFKQDFDRCEFDRQKRMGAYKWPSNFKIMKWEDILLHKEIKPATEGDVWFWSIDEESVLSDADRLGCGSRCVCVEDKPLILPPNVCLELSGLFVLAAPIQGSEASAVILRNGVCYNNPVLQGPKGDQSIYIVSSRSYLNFTPNALPTDENPLEARQSIRARVFQSLDDATFVDFSGPGRWMGLRKKESARAESTKLPIKLKNKLSRFMSGEFYCISDSWRQNAINRP